MALTATPVHPLICDPSERRSTDEREALRPGVTVLVPAYNEAESIADTVRSLQAQTHPVTAVVVIDDFSTDGTGDIARACGATVIRPPRNTGSKAGAQNFALSLVETEFAQAVCDLAASETNCVFLCERRCRLDRAIQCALGLLD